MRVEYSLAKEKSSYVSCLQGHLKLFKIEKKIAKPQSVVFSFYIHIIIHVFVLSKLYYLWTEPDSFFMLTSKVYANLS